MTIANVLLVDDEPAFLETLKKRLTARNVSVQTAPGGKEALDLLRAQVPIEVVILDVKMPGMDGIETLKAIKRAHPLVEVLMLTGHATVESAIHGMQQGAFDYLMKPCDIDQLLSKLTHACSRKRLHEEKIIQARLKEVNTRRR
jgi:DNA-binding NtrC family response regulator